MRRGGGSEGEIKGGTIFCGVEFCVEEEERMCERERRRGTRDGVLKLVPYYTCRVPGSLTLYNSLW
jgi:hypothetical protein